MSQELHPTGKCFDDALDFIDYRVQVNPREWARKALVLVHGICLSNGTLEPYSHGWVEEDGLVWDAGLLNGQRVYYQVEQPAYYAAKQVQETTKYSLRQAFQQNWRHNNYGPWEQKYIDLCVTRRPGETPTLVGHATLHPRGIGLVIPPK